MIETKAFVHADDPEIAVVVKQRLGDLFDLGQRINNDDRDFTEQDIAECLHFSRTLTYLLALSINEMSQELGTSSPEKLSQPVTYQNIVDAKMELLLFLLTGEKVKASTAAIPESGISAMPVARSKEVH